jgi:hypothetical protein
MSAGIVKGADDTAIRWLFREWIAEHEPAGGLDGPSSRRQLIGSRP